VSATADIEQNAETAGGFEALDPNELADLVAPEAPEVKPADETASEGAAGLSDPVSTAVSAVPADKAAQLDAAAASGAPVVLKTVEARGRFRLNGRWLAVAGAVLVTAAGAAWVALHRAGPPSAPIDHSAPAAAEPVAAAVQPATAVRPLVVDRLEWEAVFREIDAFHRRLLDTREEIARLQRHYDFGVRELEEEAVWAIKETGCAGLAAALKHPPLELLLQGIQRRQGYRDALSQPLLRLDQGVEELLFLERRARLDLEVQPEAQGIDLPAQHQAIRAALQAHEPTAERLAIRGIGAAVSQESVWRRLSEQARQTGFSAEDRLNQAVAADACAGNLGRLSELSSLSLKGAGCLAESGAQELFLNRLNQLPPLAAQKLAEWPGRWLCLNGLKRLPPETALELFAWAGERISLNGLGELTPEAGRYLSGWRGRQLELMGLRRLTAVEALADWEASGGKLFVPADVRQAIDTLRLAGTSSRQGAGQAR
jgi:hypothetical protein